MKPLEFKIVKTQVNTGYAMVFYYGDNTIQIITLGSIPKGLELDKHYSIADIYGYAVVDDRKGL